MGNLCCCRSCKDEKYEPQPVPPKTEQNPPVGADGPEKKNPLMKLEPQPVPPKTPEQNPPVGADGPEKNRHNPLMKLEPRILMYVLCQL